MHFRVRKLKNQLDMVISKNASKFSSSREFELLAACDAQASSASSPTFSAGNGDAISGAIYPATQNIPGYNTGDLVMPESAMSCFGGAFTCLTLLKAQWDYCLLLMLPSISNNLEIQVKM